MWACAKYLKPPRDPRISIILILPSSVVFLIIEGRDSPDVSYKSLSMVRHLCCFIYLVGTYLVVVELCERVGGEIMKKSTYQPKKQWSGRSEWVIGGLLVRVTGWRCN